MARENCGQRHADDRHVLYPGAWSARGDLTELSRDFLFQQSSAGISVATEHECHTREFPGAMRFAAAWVKCGASDIRGWTDGLYGEPRAFRFAGEFSGGCEYFGFDAEVGGVDAKPSDRRMRRASANRRCRRY